MPTCSASRMRRQAFRLERLERTGAVFGRSPQAHAMHEIRSCTEKLVFMFVVQIYYIETEHGTERQTTQQTRCACPFRALAVCDCVRMNAPLAAPVLCGICFSFMPAVFAQHIHRDGRHVVVRC